MKLQRFSKAIFLVSIPLSLLATLAAFGQARGNDGLQSGRLFSIGPIPHFRKGVDAWPLIVSPQTPEVKRVNAILAAMNRQTLASLRECDADSRNYQAMSGRPKSRVSVSGDWTRKVTITMNGPRFVSMIADETQVCTGAYPLNAFIPVVFDLKTGERIDWKLLSPAGTSIDAVAEQSPDGTSSPGLYISSLMEMAVSRADGECKHAMQDFNDVGRNSNLPFVVWPDARRGLLMTKASGLPHVAQACEEKIGLTIAEARKLRFSEELLDNLERANQAVLATQRKRTECVVAN